MFDTLLWIGGGLVTVIVMILGALKVGEKQGRQKEQLNQEKENVKNEQARDRIDTAVRRNGTDAGGLHSDYDRD